jgi:vitamin B12 transporter
LKYLDLAGACAALCVPFLAAEAQVAAAPPDNSLNEIVVTATRNPEPRTQVLESVILIDRAQLEDSLAVDVGDLLRFHAGLDIGRSGGPGQPLSLFIRGANSQQSIVMIDGVRINAGTVGGAPLQNLAPELFERIEVVEGPRSAIYGTDAIGGVVNFITRSAGPSGADVMLDYGRYATGEAAADGIYTTGDTSLRAAITGQRSDGFPTFAGDTVNSGYKNLSGVAAASTKFAGADVGALYWLSSGTTHYGEGDYDEAGNFTGFGHLDERFSNSALAVHASGDLTDLWHARLTLSRIIDDLRQDQPDPYSAPPEPAGGDFDYTSRNTLDLQNDVKVAGAAVDQLLTFGGILTQEQTNSLSFGTGYTIGTNTETYYVQDQLDSGANRLLLAGGYYHHPAFGAHETWNAEYGYSVTPSTLLIASAGTAFRAPTATDRFGYGGNPDLLPESSRDFELGVKSRIGEGQLLTLSAFQNSIDDLIENVFNPVTYTSLNENIDRARIRGIEAGWELRTDPWMAHAEGSLQDPRNLSVDAQDSQLLRRSKHSFTLGGSRRFGRGEVGIDVLQSGPREDVGALTGASGVHDGGYVLASAYGKVSLTQAWSVTARLDNALDRQYQLANGYNMAARAASISTRYAFR